MPSSVPSTIHCQQRWWCNVSWRKSSIIICSSYIKMSDQNISLFQQVGVIKWLTNTCHISCAACFTLNKIFLPATSTFRLSFVLLKLLLLCQNQQRLISGSLNHSWYWCNFTGEIADTELHVSILTKNTLYCCREAGHLCYLKLEKLGF